MKAKVSMGLAVVLLLAISCTKESNSIRSSTVNQSTLETQTFKLGQHYGGGIIFYIDTTGEHGLIADTADLPYATWWNGLNLQTGATGIGMNSGKNNTNKIVSAQGRNGSYAALECSKSKRSGYTDWFLPSKNQLDKLYRHKRFVSGLQNGNYWTSSELDYQNAWIESFIGGQQFWNYKYLQLYVRAVRAF